jgi:hypothetical protein
MSRSAIVDRLRRTALAALAVVGSAFLASDTAPVRPPAGLPVTGDVSLTSLRYSPRWLPPGIVERSRSRDPDGLSLRREWERPGAGSSHRRAMVILQVYDTAYAGRMDCRNGANVAINGVTGGLWSNGGTSAGCVRWQPDPSTVLVVTEHHLGISQDGLLRIARSMQPDPGWMTVPLRLDRPGIVATTTQPYASVRGESARDWSVALHFDQGNPGTGIWHATVSLSTKVTPPIGGRWLTTAVVGDRPARYFAVDPRRSFYLVPGEARLVVDVGSGVWLAVSVVLSPFSRDALPSMAELVAVAMGVRIAIPDLSWIGSRPD